MSPTEILIQQWIDSGISIPYVETMNTPVDTNTLPDKWGSSIIHGEARDDVTMGSRPQVEETGQIVIGLFSRSGKGQFSLDSSVQEIRDAFHGFAKDGLEIISVAGPFDMDQDADGEWWRVAMTCMYKFYSVRDAIGPGFGDWEGFPA